MLGRRYFRIEIPKNLLAESADVELAQALVSPAMKTTRRPFLSIQAEVAAVGDVMQSVLRGRATLLTPVGQGAL